MAHKDPEARKAYDREYQKANRERLNAQKREYRKANREKINAANRKYHKANSERIYAQQREYRKANAEEINAWQREYYKANSEKILAEKSEYRKANRERIKAQGREYHNANRARLNAKNREYYKANRARLNAKNREYYKEYSKANTEKIHAKNASRRARKKECSVPLTETEKTELRSMSRKMQRLNKKKGGVEYHIDHIVPMDYGGVHHPCNLRIMVGKENCSKNNKITPEALDLVPVCYRLYLERVGAEKAEWFRDEIAEAIGLQEANRLIGMERAAPSAKPTLEDLME
jgi:hypothetical protein